MRVRPAACAASMTSTTPIGHAAVGAQLNLGVGALVGDLPQALGQGGGVHRRFVQIDLAGGIDRQRYRMLRRAALGALGARQLQADAAGSSGAVRMKITTSTSITSTSGVTLMSLMGSAPLVRSRQPNAMACR